MGRNKKDTPPIGSSFLFLLLYRSVSLLVPDENAGAQSLQQLHEVRARLHICPLLHLGDKASEHCLILGVVDEEDAALLEEEVEEREARSGPLLIGHAPHGVVELLATSQCLGKLLGPGGLAVSGTVSLGSRGLGHGLGLGSQAGRAAGGGRHFVRMRDLPSLFRILLFNFYSRLISMGAS